MAISEYRNRKAQRDAVRNEYNPPNKFFPDKREREENREYREVWRKTRDNYVKQRAKNR